VVWQVFKLGSNLGPTPLEYGRILEYKTQNQPKRANHIALVSLSWGRRFKSSLPDQLSLQHQQILEATIAGSPNLGPLWVQLEAFPVSLLPIVDLL